MMVISIYLKVYIEFLFAMPDYECYTRVHPPKWMATVAAHFGLKHTILSHWILGFRRHVANFQYL